MADDGPTVHLFCGLNGAGKSRLARELEVSLPAVRFTLDEWMLRLHGGSFEDPAYVNRVPACRELIWDTAVQVLALGHHVLLDWNQWSVQRRSEWARRSATAGYPVLLHFVDVPLETAAARLAQRNNDRPPHAHRISVEHVRHLASIFEPPTEAEGIPIVRHAST